MPGAVLRGGAEPEGHNALPAPRGWQRGGSCPSAVEETPQDAGLPHTSGDVLRVLWMDQAQLGVLCHRAGSAETIVTWTSQSQHIRQQRSPSEGLAGAWGIAGTWGQPGHSLHDVAWGSRSLAGEVAGAVGSASSLHSVCWEPAATSVTLVWLAGAAQTDPLRTGVHPRLQAMRTRSCLCLDGGGGRARAQHSGSDGRGRRRSPSWHCAQARETAKAHRSRRPGDGSARFSGPERSRWQQCCALGRKQLWGQRSSEGPQSAGHCGGR